MSFGVERREVGLQREQFVARAEHDGHPAGAVVDPLRRADRLALDARLRAIAASVAASTAPLRRSGGAANASRLPSRRTRTRPTPHCCTISSRESGLAAGREPRVAGAERRMAREGQLGGSERRCAHDSRRSGSVGGSKNVVSLKFVQCANLLHRRVRQVRSRRARRRARCRRAASAVKTSTVL